MTIGGRLERIDAAIRNGELDRARRLITNELREAERHGDASGMARCHQLFGNVEEIERNAGSALRSWSRALYLYAQAGVTDDAETKRLRQLIRLWHKHQTVFVSYARHDGPLIRPILDRLVARGITLEIDDEFLAGRAIEGQIRSAIERCPKFLVFFSPAYAERAWTRYELQIFCEKVEKDREARAGDCCVIFVCLPRWKARADVIEPFSDSVFVELDAGLDAACDRIARAVTQSVLEA